MTRRPVDAAYGVLARELDIPAPVRVSSSTIIVLQSTRIDASGPKLFRVVWPLICEG